MIQDIAAVIMDASALMSNEVQLELVKSCSKQKQKQNFFKLISRTKENIKTAL
jgi:hypothetical protein